MSIAAGGRADKLGGRYEGLWVAVQLVRLLAEEISTVQLEAVGDDEAGVDLWVTRQDGTRDAYQCKRKNRTTGKWSVSVLEQGRVLGRLAGQLTRDATARYTLVSADPAPELRALADNARLSGDDAEVYFQTTRGVKAHASNLRQFCQAVGADDGIPTGRRTAFDILRRTHTHLFEDSEDGRADVYARTRVVLNGDPRTAIEVLANFAQDRMGHSLTAEDVRRHMAERGIETVSLVGNRLVADRVEQLRAEFDESLRPALIHATVVPRPEAETVFRAVDRGERLVVLHGRAGGGKSCVLLRLAGLLDAAGIPYLPLRLDRRPPRTSARSYGVEGCDLPESPAVTLARLYPGRRSVLILDQLDAVRWSAAHASAPWEACREVIDEGLALPGVSVVVACRTFDLRDDQQIRAWLDRTPAPEVEVGDLPEETVAAVLASTGDDYAGLSAGQKILLRSPLHLALWTQVRAAGGRMTRWITQADLLRAYWQTRYQAAERLGVPLTEFRAAVNALVDDLDRYGELSAPLRVLEPFKQASDALRSLNVVVESNRRLSFGHQTYFEYQLATRLLDAARDGGVVGWVRGTDQSLLRRDQLRLLLTLLRDEDPAGYVRTTRDLVLAPPTSVRFHLRQLTLRVLGEAVDPSAAECDLVCELARRPEWREHVLDQVFTRNPVWFAAADDRGLVAEWLAAVNENLIESALQLCRWWSGVHGDRVVARLVPYIDNPDPWPRWVEAALPFNPANDTPDLFRLRLKFVRRGVFRHRHLAAAELASAHPGRLIDLLEAYLAYRIAAPPPSDRDPRDEREFPYLVPSHEAEHLERTAELMPDSVWRQLVPLVLKACEATLEEPRTGRPEPFLHDRAWPTRYHDLYEYSTELLRIVARSGARLATDDPIGFSAANTGLFNHPGRSVQYMVGWAFAGAGPDAADHAVEWLCNNPHRLGLPDDRGRRWALAEEIIRRFAGTCSTTVYARLEQAILRYHEPDERQSIEYQLRCVRAGWPISPNCCGLTAHALLRHLPPDRLTGEARSRMGVLERKFGKAAAGYDQDRRGRIRTVIGPLRDDRIRKISDSGWLQIIRGAARTETHRLREVDPDTVADTTADAFSQSFGNSVRWEPGRFAALQPRIPDTADPAYLTAALHGLTAVEPPSTDAVGWTPASDGQLAAVFEHVGYQEDRRIGNGMCWLMWKRPGAVSTPGSLATLARYATDHPHPEPGWTLLTNGGEDIDAAAMNCTRGIALGAIGQVLFDRPHSLPSLLPAIGRAVADPHPAVRVAAFAACLPLLNTDRDLGVELFLTGCEGPDECLTSREVAQFCRYAVWTHFTRLEPLFRRMAASSVPAVATAGATWVTIAWLIDRGLWRPVEECLRGTPAQRRGVAAAASHNCGDPRFGPRCADLLVALAEDSDAGVQDEMAGFLRQPDVLRIPGIRETAVGLLSGAGLRRHAYWIVEALRRHPGSLIPLAPVLQAACGRITTDRGVVGPSPGGGPGFDLDRFVPLLLRLYEQAEQAKDRELRTTCLDWWDRLLETRMGGTRQILADLDAAPADAW